MAIKCPKDKDELIVRQSQMERAIELYALLGTKPTVQEVCRLSQILTELYSIGTPATKTLKTFPITFKNKLKMKIELIKKRRSNQFC